MTQRKFSMKKMALKSTFGFTTVNHYYTEDERQVFFGFFIPKNVLNFYLSIITTEGDKIIVNRSQIKRCKMVKKFVSFCAQMKSRIIFMPTHLNRGIFMKDPIQKKAR